MKTLSLICPVFNEEETVDLFYDTVRAELRGLPARVEIVFVNDGSTDSTEDRIGALAEKDSLVRAYSFTRNFGKEAALFCGLENCSGDCAIPIDVDLQDPVSLIPEMFRLWEAGNDAVLAKRIDRTSDSWLKRKTAEWFYRLNNYIATNQIEPNVGDFRLIDRRIIEAVTALSERTLFMKGVLSWPGGKTAVVEYKRSPRSAGESKFNGWKLWNFALDGITSFSTVPLRIWSYVGSFVALMSMIYMAWTVVEKLVFGNPVAGYPSILCGVLFLGGVQLIGIGMLGEYIGRIYAETKHRPRYLLKTEDFATRRQIKNEKSKLEVKNA